jgi:hypothetical protein
MKLANVKIALTALGVAGLVFALVPQANAAMSPSPLEAFSSSDIQMTAGGCGPGYRRTVFGYHCVREVTQHRCQAGLHSEPFPNGRGYRCVFN